MACTYENLLVRFIRRDGPCVLEQSIAERALSMVNVRHNAKVSISLNWNSGYSCFNFGG
jgi:hypothetical protein